MGFNDGFYDSIVIGSGMGGLSAAGLLAKAGGKRVLVLERHTQLGGLTHVFRRNGASWDVGVHYVGDLEEGSQSRLLMDYLTQGKVKWNKLPETFERFRFPGLSLCQPSEFGAWRAELESAFPEEKQGIRRWFRDLEAAARWSVLGFVRQFMPRPLSLPLGLIAAPGRKRYLRTTAEVLSRHIKDPRLKSLLCATWGDYGLLPEESAFAVHALVATHYRHGAWFPVGGSGRLSRAIETGIEEAGGLCLVGWQVEEILRNPAGRACGVRARNTGSTGEVREFFSDTVISDAGALRTFDGLLPGGGSRALQRLRSRLRAVKPGYSAVTLYLAFRENPGKLGPAGENYWIYTTPDLGSIERQTKALLAGRPEHAFLSFPSLKNGDDRFHTAEIIAPVDPKIFAPWKNQPQGRRGADYQKLKERLSDALLALAELEVPGLSGLVSYRELSTPLSVEHFDAKEGGTFYGLAARPERYRIRGLGARTPVKGLYLTGSDACALGIIGAMMGGVAATTAILGGPAYLRIMARARAFAAGKRQRPALRETQQHPARYFATLSDKKWVTPRVIDACFRLDRPLAFEAGQFAKLEVGPGEWRDYSLVEASDGTARFLVSTATGGGGSLWFSRAQLSDRIRLEGPFGAFRLNPGHRRRVFVATGTGLAPLLAMMHAMPPGDRSAGTDLLLGSRTLAETVLTDNSRAELEKMGICVTLCISREKVATPAFGGRVTAMLESIDFDADITDFYLCGAPAMVNDALAVLHRRGAKHIFTERY
jgi:all-trans-retinol 13,14-reductase